ncbi:hypothetical protein [Bdellovibrio svalbardensis]|uniref:Outer membrane protein beta-barrel domain-containing protein n=1 Tax=Bdellovibrio svalbardensis TaxID=2972972 RepID=A0ABT6DKU4_9BACT|nr:hypothetical protein [Bdellovibrio svalbardensis]MDG0817482.1 hypothetical protein [Bdellovibrio svalbardensis]
MRDICSIKVCLLTFALSTFVGPKSYASSPIEFSSTKLNLFQEIYSGESYKSLAQGSPGFGIEFSRDAGGTYFRTYAKGRFGASSGKQKFLDGSSQVNADYSYYFTQGELGLQVYPIARRDVGVNLFIGAGGVLGLNSLGLKPISGSFSQLKAQQQAIAFGYIASIGLEMIFSGANSRHFMGTLEAAYRQQQAALAGQDEFDLGGLSISVGMGW